jgi:DNA-binding HxlR family transcriptional regulator
MLGKEYPGQDCALARTLEVLGERWTLLIVRDAFYGVERFNDFQAHLDIPKAVLSERLSGLVEDGILEREPDPRHAGRHLYRLSKAGQELWPALHALLSWGSQHRAQNAFLFTHARCGTTLEQGGACPKCRETPEPEEITMKRRPGRASRREDPVTLALQRPHRLLEPIKS